MALQLHRDSEWSMDLGRHHSCGLPGPAREFLVDLLVDLLLDPQVGGSQVQGASATCSVIFLEFKAASLHQAKAKVRAKRLEQLDEARIRNPET